MDRCPRCSKVVAANWAYCLVCGRPRILESLQQPVVQPAWKQRVWQGVVVVMSLWLVVTVGVAFIREAKAVRDSRALLAEGKAQEAWSILKPFRAAHPEHRQALFLCGKATVRLGLRDEPKNCLRRLGELSPELAKELRADYGPILSEQARSLSCNAEAFGELLGWGDELGADFAGNVIAGLDGVVEACRASQNEHELTRIAAMLKERGTAISIVERGYVPAIGRAVAQARYKDTEALARQAVELVPEGAKAVEAALKDERQKVAVTEETLRRLGGVLQSDMNKGEGGWCFPSDTPPAVQSARDGWGNPIIYNAQGNQFFMPDQPEAPCQAGFTLTSYGSDGVETERDWQQTPDAEIIYSFFYGSESWQRPSGFWRTTG